MSENNENYNGRNFRLVTPKEDNTVKYNTANLSDLLGDSHLVYTSIAVNGEKVLHDTSFTLKIEQNTLAQSTFTIDCPSEAFEDHGAYPFQQSKYLIGKRISIQFYQHGKPASFFTGIIKGVEMERKDGYTFLSITGESPTSLLEGGKNCRSFENLTLEEIIKKVIQEGNYPADLLETNINPKHKDPIPFIVQYFQTDYQLLQSLAQRYGEWLYHDGNKLVFGGYGGKTVELKEQQDVQEYKFFLYTAPQQFGAVCFDAVSAQTIQADSKHLPKQDIVNPMQNQAVNASKDMYPEVSNTLHNSTTQQELSKEIQRQKTANENLMAVKAKSQNAEIKIGDIVKLTGFYPENESFRNPNIPLESYLITEIQHHYQQSEGYYNTFTAIPKEQRIPPYYDHRAYPRAEQQRAVVTDNNDPQGIGRVRVRFLWQGENDQSPWVRMVFPYAGAGKGFYFIPETGEEVEVSFEMDCMERPLVMGALYNGNEKSGYHTTDNRIKAIHTPSGTKIIINDKEGSIYIEDPSGNSYFMDGKGNISLKAPNDMNFTAGNNMNFNIGKQALFQVGEKMQITSPVLRQYITDRYLSQAGSTLISSVNRTQIESPKVEIAGQKELLLHSDETATLNSKGTAQVRGTQQAYFDNEAQSYEPVKEEIKPKCMVHFRPHDGYEDNPDYGFDFERLGDSGLRGDFAWKDIVGKYYNEAGCETVFTENPNTWTPYFKKDPDMYTRLLNTFTCYKADWKKDKDGNPFIYTVPVLNMFEGSTALFTLITDIEEKPKKMTFEFQNKKADQYYQISRQEITEIQDGKQTLKDYLKITCTQACSSQQILEVKADGQTCGALKILPNTKKYQKEMKVVYIKVKTNLNELNDIKGEIKLHEKKLLEQVLAQALIVPSFEEEELNCIDEEIKTCFTKTPNGQYIFGGGDSKSKALLAYLRKKTKEQFGTKYDKCFVMFFIGEESKTLGFVYNSRHATCFLETKDAKKNKFVAVHELLHTLSLNHTFDCTVKEYSYQAMHTNNVMDYTNQAVPRYDGITLYQWQWQKIHSYLKGLIL